MPKPMTYFWGKSLAGSSALTVLKDSLWLGSAGYPTTNRYQLPRLSLIHNLWDQGPGPLATLSHVSQSLPGPACNMITV